MSGPADDSNLQGVIWLGDLENVDDGNQFQRNLDFALSLANKRLKYCKDAKPCPKCGTDQVQLVSWINEVEWKCRYCKHEWRGNK